MNLQHLLSSLLDYGFSRRPVSRDRHLSSTTVGSVVQPGISPQETCISATRTYCQFLSNSSAWIKDWTSTIDSCRGDSKVLWLKLQVQMSALSYQNLSHFSADYFAAFFTSKVDKIRASTSSAPSPVIKTQLVTTPLSRFESVSVEEVTRLLSRTPAKHCRLGSWNVLPTLLLQYWVRSAMRHCSQEIFQKHKLSPDFSTTQEADVGCWRCQLVSTNIELEFCL